MPNPPIRQRHVGGSFAPPIDDAALERYEGLASALDESPVRSGMLDLVRMLRRFRETPASTLPAKPHPATRTLIVTPLEPAEVARIFDVVPWREECDMLGRVFEVLPPGPTRDAAFHLLWFAYELTADREPITSDKLGA
jgi:hypothetical protein